MRTTIVIAVVGMWSGVVTAAPVDCSDAYGGKATQCERATCDALQLSFVGTWKGPFQAYVKELSKPGKPVVRPYDNTTTYAATDCLKHAGETFIVGHMTDVYPAFSGLPARTAHSLLITGTATDGSPFLRIVDDKQVVSTYRLDYKSAVASLAIWSLVIPGHDHAPEIELTTIDGRDFTTASVDRRNVTITMRVGPKDAPLFEGVVGSGYHTRQP